MVQQCAAYCFVMCFFFSSLSKDVVYDPSVVPCLVSLLHQLLIRGGSSSSPPSAYIASTVRNEDTRDAFLVALGKQHLTLFTPSNF